MSRFHVDLRDFFKTGSFGPIHLGQSRQEIESILGKPQNWGGTYHWWSNEKTALSYKFTMPYTEYPFWAYDAIEFYFGDDEQTLYQIYCDHLDKLQKTGEVFDLERWLFQATTSLTYQELEKGLLEEDIPFKFKPDNLWGEIVLASGVTISYEYNDDTVSSICHTKNELMGEPFTSQHN